MEHVKALQLPHANYVILNKNVTRKLKMKQTENFQGRRAKGLSILFSSRKNDVSLQWASVASAVFSIIILVAASYQNNSKCVYSKGFHCLHPSSQTYPEVIMLELHRHNHPHGNRASCHKHGIMTSRQEEADGMLALDL